MEVTNYSVNLMSQVASKLDTTTAKPSRSVPNKIQILTSPYYIWTLNKDKESLKSFWMEYCSVVFDDEQDYPLMLAEMTGEHTCLTLELTFPFIDYKNDDLYSSDLIYKIIYIIQKIIKEKFQLSRDKVELNCVVLESEEPWQDQKLWMTSARFQFPNCRASIEYQRGEFKTQFIKEMNEAKILNDVPNLFNNSLDKIIDSNIPYDFVPLYPSPKDTVRSKYNVMGYIAEIESLEQINNQEINELKLEDIFFPQYHDIITSGMVSMSLFSTESDLNFWIPLFLSVNYHTKLTPFKNQGVTEISNRKNKNKNFKVCKNSNLQPKDFIDDLLPLITDDRKCKESTCLEIGKALYHAYNGNKEALSIWIDWVSKAEKPVFTEEQCKNHFNDFSTNGNMVTYKTLAWYAKLDSPHEYNEWHKFWLTPALEFGVSATHTDVAEAFYRLHWLEFIFVNKKWYQFTDHRWHRLDEGEIQLGCKISTSLLKAYSDLRLQKSAEARDTSDEKQRNFLDELIEGINIIIRKLKTVSFKSALTKELREKFYVEDFDKRLDANPYLIGLSNGVIELTSTDAYVRHGKPEDYISMSTKIPYRYDYKEDSKAIKQYLEYMLKVFPDEELRYHVLKFNSSVLLGVNREKMFSIFSGQGNNSKSVYIKTQHTALGQYSIDIPSSAFTQKRPNSSAPTPEVARSKGARAVVASEPEETDNQVQTGFIKLLTGNDRIFSRGLYDGGSEFNFTAKLIMVCNKPPSIANGSKAIRNRLRIIPFLSTFSKEAPSSFDEQLKTRHFPCDDSIEDQIPELAQAMLWYAVKTFPNYLKEGFTDPKLVLEQTKMYWDDVDVYSNFINSCIIINPNESSTSVTMGELYTVFKAWFRNSYPGLKIPELPIVRQELILSSRLGPQTNKRWTGIRFSDILV